MHGFNLVMSLLSLDLDACLIAAGTFQFDHIQYEHHLHSAPGHSVLLLGKWCIFMLGMHLLNYTDVLLQLSGLIFGDGLKSVVVDNQ